jgi:uncharacterized protein YkwD
MKKALTLALLSTALALLLLPAASKAAVTATATEKKVISLVNKERAKRGLAPVRFQPTLTRAAREHSRQMARRGVLTHMSANGDTVGQRLVRCGYTRTGYRSWSVGECVGRARAGTLSATPAGMVSLWMGSKAHRQVILTARFRQIGVGVAKSADGMRYFTLDMGRRTR